MKYSLGIRSKVSFALLRSALLCLRGSRSPRRVPLNLEHCDLEIEKSKRGLETRVFCFRAVFIFFLRTFYFIFCFSGPFSIALLRTKVYHLFCNNNHKNYNFLNCDWFKKLLFPTNSLVKLLSDSLLSDSLLSDSLLSDSSTNQSNSKL